MLHGLIYSFKYLGFYEQVGNVLNVSFHPSEIGKQLDLNYIRFKRGARHELTQVARVRQASSILPDALVRDLRSRTGRKTVSIKEHHETGCVWQMAAVIARTFTSVVPTTWIETSTKTFLSALPYGEEQPMGMPLNTYVHDITVFIVNTVSFSKTCTLKPVFKSLHFQALSLLCKWMAKKLFFFSWNLCPVNTVFKLL